jgi:hypothetical protein
MKTCVTGLQDSELEIAGNAWQSIITVGAGIVGASTALRAGQAAGQQAERTLKEQLVGTALLVSNYNERPDGSKFEPLGANPTGMLIFDGNGRMSSQLMRSGLPKFASNNRQEGTPEENKAVVQGVLCYFGTYSVNEVDRALNFHIESSSFPNWNGTDQKAIFHHY